MAGKKKDAGELARALNSLEMGREYTIQELKIAFNCGNRIVVHLCDAFLTKVRVGIYRRDSDSPIYKGRIETAMERLRKSLCQNNRIKKLELTEENCVKFLKEKGYRIMRPTFEEV